MTWNILWNYGFNFSDFIASVIFIIPIAGLALKLPRETIQKGVLLSWVSNVNSKLSRNDSKSSYDLLGDL